MLDKVAMITFLVIYIICLFITIIMYLVIIGANENKTETHNKSMVVNFLNNLKEKHKEKKKMVIEKIKID